VARAVLAKLDATGAEAVDYVPAQLNDLPKRLQQRAFEDILLNQIRPEKMRYEVTQVDFDFLMGDSSAYFGLNLNIKPTAFQAGSIFEQYERQRLEELRELAQSLGLRFEK
jgi:hypothetical protein